MRVSSSRVSNLNTPGKAMALVLNAEAVGNEVCSSTLGKFASTTSRYSQEKPLSVSRSSTRWNSDDTRASWSRAVNTSLSGGGKSPSLKSSENTRGDAPASSSIRWDAYDATSVQSAAELLQRVASYHDVDRSVLAVRKWLNGLPWLDGENTEARIYIRAEVMDHFLHVWHPQSQKESITFHDKAEPSLISIKLLDALHHAKILESTDIALAAEFLFKHRLRTGYMHALYELISTAGVRASLHGVLNRMSALAEKLKKSKKGMTCQDVKLQTREIICTIESLEREQVFHILVYMQYHYAIIQQLIPSVIIETSEDIAQQVL
ncbi:hypothetical protein EW145_g3946 [Phellinidium pouzarii]|uniref:Uncharacterized protein n=1 Tax=Phellinidium pouzarii TaxID=167371 RepID=A0A4S4L5I8_9AGAM|nr:hypothetical protein EW145_g3946 [Phellinidium pouzarii]